MSKMGGEGDYAGRITMRGVGKRVEQNCGAEGMGGLGDVCSERREMGHCRWIFFFFLGEGEAH